MQINFIYLALFWSLFSVNSCFIQKCYALESHNSSLKAFTFSSKSLNNKRDLWVYTPKDYKSDRPYPLLIVFDGQAYVSDLVPGPQILDQLISEKKIPPLIGVFVSSIDQPSRNVELPCHPPFVKFLVKELLPWVKSQYNISDNPENILLAGSSYGGLAAVYAAANHPEQFGCVLSQSGAFWWKSKKDKKDKGILHLVKNQSYLPVKFYLDVGNQETEKYDNQPSMLEINREMRDILRFKGCQVYYNEFNGGHDYACWKQTFSVGLIALLGR